MSEHEELAAWLLTVAASLQEGSFQAPRLRRAAALLRESRPQQGWQPIDSAPQDGSEILASDYDNIEIVSWNCEPFDCETGEGPAWCDREGLRMFPAWWQPLPEDPPIPTESTTTND